MNRPYRPRLAALLLAQMLLSPAFAGTIWDGGAAPDTSIGNAVNWDLDTLPDLTGPSILTFGVANGTATIDTPIEATRVAITNSFTIAAGDGTLTVRGTSGGSNSYGLQATSGAANAIIDEPVLVKGTAPNSGLLGSLLLIYNNRVVSNTTTFHINGGIALAPGSTSTSYSLRYGNNTSSSANTSDTRIAGPITGMSTLSNSSAGGNWAGDLIIAGDQAGLATTDITMGSSGFLAPAASARLVLGETKDDDQVWRNVTLNNVMNLAIGGNITVGTLSTSTTLATKITGTAVDLASAGTLTVASGTVNSVCTIGGADAKENNLNLVKTGTGTLTFNGAHTYLGSTTVNAGTLSIATGSIASPVTVKSAAALTIAPGAAANGEVAIESGATLAGEGGIAGGLTFAPGFGYLNFDPATPGALSVASVTGPGASIVVTPVSAGALDTAYLVLTSTTSLAGLAFTVGAPGSVSLQNGGTELWFTPSVATAKNLLWTGADAASPSLWNVAAVQNWSNGSAPAAFYGGDNVVFDDTGVTTEVTVQGTVAAGTVTFNNSAKSYALSGGSLSGSGAIVQTGNGSTTLANILANTGGVTVNAGSLVLTGANTFTGGLDVTGGTLSFTGFGALGATATAIDINSGGILRYSGATTVTNDAFNYTLGTGGGSISIDTNANVTVRLGGKISGDGAIAKTGTGILSLGRSSDVDPANDFTGAFTVSAGTLDIRAPQSLGATSAGTTFQDAVLLIQNFGQSAGTKSFAAEPLVFSGNAYLTTYGQEARLYTNQLTGPITVSAGATLGISAARNASAALSPTLELTGSGIATGAGSTVSFGLRPAVYPSTLLEDAQTVNVTAPITGPAAVVVQGTAPSLYTLASPGYSGDTTVLGGTLKLDAANTANDAATVTVASSDAALELNFSGTDTVARLFVGTTQLAAGVYKAVGNGGATGTEIAQLIGTGTLTVTTGPSVLTPYQTWAAGFGLTGDDALAASDPDGDGLSNILEYATDGSPVAAGSANVSIARSGAFLSLTYTRIADTSLTYTVEGTDDLTGTWSAVLVSGNPSSGADNVAGPVTITDTVSLTGAAKRFLRLRVSY